MSSQLGIATLTVLIAAIGLFYRVMNNIKSEIKNVAEDAHEKRTRIYTRFDENKEATDKKYVMKEICHVKTDQILKANKRQDATLVEVKADIKKILLNGKNRG